MEFVERELSGVFEILLHPYVDNRGCFARSFDEDNFKINKLPVRWAQENISQNHRSGIVRGLHFLLNPYTDGKLIRCSRGEVWDVVVDLRRDSATMGKHLITLLNEKDLKWLYIPKGFAHGYCSLSEWSELIYKHDTAYERNADSGIVWNDPVLKINWPVSHPVLSEKDSKLMSYEEFIVKHGGL
jgi:dTDP-4-dehydrorhamnose 3,5-epimerase